MGDNLDKIPGLAPSSTPHLTSPAFVGEEFVLSPSFATRTLQTGKLKARAHSHQMDFGGLLIKLRW
jgi:hypothetical protein